MDYTGLEYKNFRFPVNRPLTDDERNNRYSLKNSTTEDPAEFISTVRLNSKYIELVDRWYAIKGFNALAGFMFGGVGCFIILLCTNFF